MFSGTRSDKSPVGHAFSTGLAMVTSGSADIKLFTEDLMKGVSDDN